MGNRRRLPLELLVFDRQPCIPSIIDYAEGE
jgi:hypothetical protein